MEAIKDLVSTRFGIMILCLWFISKIAEANPAIAEKCVYTMAVLTLAHVISRTIKGGNGKEGISPPIINSEGTPVK